MKRDIRRVKEIDSKDTEKESGSVRDCSRQI